jgi:hypothetical protein
MKQYRVTSEHFVPRGETGETDAVMDPADLRDLKRLAGIPITEEGIWTGNKTTPQGTEVGIESPVGSNISWTAEERNNLIKEYNTKPGDQLWMLIMFAKPGINHKSLKDQVEDYLRKNPKQRFVPKLMPGQDE